MKRYGFGRVTLAEPDPRADRSIADMLIGLDMDVVVRSIHAEEIIRSAESGAMDLIILSMALPGCDALTVIEKIKALRAPAMPAVAVTALRGMERYADQAIHMGACAALHKPFGIERLEQMLGALTHESRLPPDFAKEASVKAMLDRLHVPPHLLGRQYLFDAISLAVRDERLLDQLGATLYPAVAARTGSTGSRVERSIRSAIESAWSQGRIEHLYGFFEGKIDAKRGKPTNREFIARICEALRMGE